MKIIDSGLSCPSCNKTMKPKVMCCEACDCELRGHFSPLPFSELNSEDVQFIRLFIHCEGRIRDMERALGVSYPTVKARLARLDLRLNGEPTDGANSSRKIESTKINSEEGDETSQQKNSIEGILRDLESGEIDFKTALSKIKK